MITKNKIIPIVILSILIIILISPRNNKELTNKFSELIKSKETINDIRKVRELSNEDLIDSIFFDDNKLFFDSINNCFYYSLVEGSESAYDPVVKWNDNVEIIFEDKKITNDIISNSESINFIVFNDAKYIEYKLICTTLPLLNVITSEKLDIVDDMAVFSKRYNSYNMKLQMFNNDANVDVRTVNYTGRINVRGNDTTKYVKKGFKIEIDSIEVEDQKQETTCLLNLREGNDYILYAGYNDAEKIRNVFSSRLWYESCANNNLFNISNGMYYKYIELFINNEYYGLYAMGFPIDDLQEEISINYDSIYQIDNIYKKDLNSCEYDFDFQHPENNGYVIASNSGKGSFIPLVNYYESMLIKNISELYSQVDINNSIDIFLYNNLVQNVDCVKDETYNKQSLYNIYIISKAYGDGNIMLYCPWDLDRTWGYGFGDNVYDVPYNANCVMEYNIVYLLLTENNKDIKEMVINRYNELRENEWSNNNVLEILNGYEKNIFDSGAFVRDKQRWPDGNYIEVCERLNVFKNYVINRLEYFDNYIIDLVDYNQS